MIGGVLAYSLANERVALISPSFAQIPLIDAPRDFGLDLRQDHPGHGYRYLDIVVLAAFLPRREIRAVKSLRCRFLWTDCDAHGQGCCSNPLTYAVHIPWFLSMEALYPASRQR